jgi:hypothetical protein
MANLEEDDLVKLKELEKQGMLDDPDPESSIGQDQEEQYAWTEEFQRKILGLLINDSTFVRQSLGLIKPSYFGDEVHQEVCRTVLNHFTSYGVRPDKIYIQQSLEDKIGHKGDAIKLRYLAEFYTICEYFTPGVEDRDFLRDKTVDFAKEQACKIAFYKCLEIFKSQKEESKWSRINSLLREALIVDRDFEIGTEYFEDYEERYKRAMKAVETGDIFTSGFDSIDSALAGGGLLRGTIGAFCAPSGGCKSLCLVRAALRNLHRGKRILYVSTEMDEDGIAFRFDAQLADPANKFGVGINNLLQKKEIVFESLHEYTRDKDDKRLLIIKQFPAGSMDVPTFRAYYAQVLLYGFKPDIVIIDYVGEMKDYPNMPGWESKTKIVREFRGFATEENVLGLTALQPNRSGKEKIRIGEVLDDESLSEYAQIRPLDYFWTINRRQIEIEANIGRIFVSKHRGGSDHFEFHFKFDRRTLGIDEIGKDTYNSVLKKTEHNKDIRTDAAKAEGLIRDNQAKKNKKPNDDNKQKDLTGE